MDISFDEGIKISVIVPIYNSEKYLRECVESILTQTFTKFELLLVNDGSKDKSSIICDEYAAKDNRVKVIHKQNAGVSAARNDGIKIACGKYLMFVDSDDTIEPTFFEKAYCEAEEHCLDLYISGVKMLNVDGDTVLKEENYTLMKESSEYSVKQLLEDLDKTYPPVCILGPCCKLYKTEILKKNSIMFDESISRAEDAYFNFEFLKHIKSIWFSNSIFYNYMRRNEDSLYSKFYVDIYEIHYQYFETLRKLMQEFNAHNETIEASYFSNLFNGLHQYKN